MNHRHLVLIVFAYNDWEDVIKRKEIIEKQNTYNLIREKQIRYYNLTKTGNIPWKLTKARTIVICLESWLSE